MCSLSLYITNFHDSVMPLSVCMNNSEMLLRCSVLALHNLIDNQEQRVWQEKLGQKRPELKNGKVMHHQLPHFPLL